MCIPPARHFGRRPDDDYDRRELRRAMMVLAVVLSLTVLPSLALLAVVVANWF